MTFMEQNPYDGKVLDKRLKNLGRNANRSLLAREAENMSPNTLRAVLENDEVSERSILRVIRALERLEIRFASRTKARASA